MNTLHTQLTALCCTLVGLGYSLPLWAKEMLSFKKEPILTLHWFHYTLLATLLLLLLWIMKKQAMRSMNTNKSYSLELIPLQGKSKAYILSYHNQRVVIAENPQAIAIHHLPQVEEM